jgi:hypothetical protein
MKSAAESASTSVTRSPASSSESERPSRARIEHATQSTRTALVQTARHWQGADALRAAHLFDDDLESDQSAGDRQGRGI